MYGGDDEKSYGEEDTDVDFFAFLGLRKYDLTVLFRDARRRIAGSFRSLGDLH